MVTLELAILLAFGLLMAKLCQRIRMPSVTGYIVAGVILGPIGFAFITKESIGPGLDHFANMALMLIAFGIGEQIELNKLKEHVRSIVWVAVSQAIAPFILIFVSIFLVVNFTNFTVGTGTVKEFFVFSLLLGAIGVATAPAATLLVIKELRAKGVFTSTLMAVVAIDDGLAIIIFGIIVSVSHQLIGGVSSSLPQAISSGVMEIVYSLLLGAATGLLIDFVLQRLKNKEEMVTAGLALLLLCGEMANYLHLSPLLAGMTAGFILVNKDERDVRVFRVLNAFEPPIYVLFFTIAGTHLDITAITVGGFVGLIYFFVRIFGKIAGTFLGALIGKSSKVVRKYLGFALLPQAGVAIGFVFIISRDPYLSDIGQIITPIVLSGVFLSEIVGPLGARYAVTHAGEVSTGDVMVDQESSGIIKSKKNIDFYRSNHGIRIVPWTWKKLVPGDNKEDVVVYGSARNVTAPGLARVATILAHFYNASPMGVRVHHPGTALLINTFIDEEKEVLSMGYQLEALGVPDIDIASGLVAATEYNNAMAIVLGYPLVGTMSKFDDVLEKVSKNVSCPVVVVKFFAEMHTERILIPVTGPYDLREVYPIVCALDLVGEQQVEILYLLPSETDDKTKQQEMDILEKWLEQQDIKLNLNLRAVLTDSRVDTIITESRDYNLVVMGAEQSSGVKKLFFGSLPDAVAKHLQKTLMIVYMPTGEKK